MAWNDNGMGSGPWGHGGGVPPQPPDVDQIVRLLKERIQGGRNPLAKIGPILIVIAITVWMATGIYVVGPDENGVVLRFGRHVETTGPGPHWRLPYPIATVLTPKVTKVERIEIGYRSRARGDVRSAGDDVDVPAESLMLTGDENIIDIDMSVQYRIKDGGAANYLFNSRNPSGDRHKVVRDAAESSIRQVIGRNEIDSALTAGKEKIQSDAKQTMQKILDSYNSGIMIVAVQLQKVAPPPEVVHAFKDVASAREDRERAVNEAQGYANDILPKAKGEAAKVIQEAEAYRTAKVIRAQGDVHRFQAILKEYVKARDVTETRLYLESMEEVLSGINKVIVDPKAGQNLLPYLQIPPSMGKGTRQDGNAKGDATHGRGEAQ
ncbi:MAG: FtsH protease activity modulator HflK [Magnetococcales bacterium]|nr:FtsH protease activity modulator HflK [Magnetococcales bacterium]NGZ04939.1 FtsH protease activity modulator HflK [Magnetococcales bacterium]